MKTIDEILQEKIVEMQLFCGLTITDSLGVDVTNGLIDYMKCGVEEWIQQIRGEYEEILDAPKLVTEDLRLLDELLENIKTKEKQKEVTLEEFVKLLLYKYPSVVKDANNKVDGAFEYLVGIGLKHSKARVSICELELEIKRQLMDK